MQQARARLQSINQQLQQALRAQQPQPAQRPAEARRQAVEDWSDEEDSTPGEFFFPIINRHFLQFYISHNPCQPSLPCATLVLPLGARCRHSPLLLAPRRANLSHFPCMAQALRRPGQVPSAGW